MTEKSPFRDVLRGIARDIKKDDRGLRPRRNPRRLLQERLNRKVYEENKLYEMINSGPWTNDQGVNVGPRSRKHPKGKGI